MTQLVHPELASTKRMQANLRAKPNVSYIGRGALHRPWGAARARTDAPISLFGARERSIKAQMSCELSNTEREIRFGRPSITPRE
ncbi:hypothetical protein EVAR_25721_1 [Eumeta japonica]|uniref:Uncharacterized protein n=1 Tax=Eumeta variegata TaxID=151549 RepID=A0A4C1YVM7_EUMVA|nr:hypothetical protein EVAR_25721_1 [Eumeta japonica]